MQREDTQPSTTQISQSTRGEWDAPCDRDDGQSPPVCHDQGRSVRIWASCERLDRQRQTRESVGGLPKPLGERRAVAAQQRARPSPLNVRALLVFEGEGRHFEERHMEIGGCGR
jgi:hypothetical protein